MVNNMKLRRSRSRQSRAMIPATGNVKGTVGASQSRGRGAVKIWDNEILDYRAIGPTGKEISKTFASTGEDLLTG